MNIIDCHTHVGVELGPYLRGEFPYAQHLLDLVLRGREQGISRWIVFPMVSNLSLGLAALRQGIITTEGALESVPFVFENDRLSREIHELFAPETADCVLQFAFFDPLRNVAGQVSALRALKDKYPISGLKTQPTMLEAPIRHLLREGLPILELAGEWDLPILIHSSILPADIWSQAHDILDIAERFPALRFCAAHSCRFDKPSLDRLAELPNCWFDVSAHGIHCQLAEMNSAVVAPPKRRFLTDYSRPAVALADLAAAYPQKIMWGSDAPYYSWVGLGGDERLALISSYKEEADYFHAMTQEAKQAAGWDNIVNWLGREVL